MLENIILFGGSGHAKVVIDIVEKQKKFQIAGIIDREKIREDIFFNYPILGSDDDIMEIVKNFDITGGIVAIGDNWIRSEVVSRIKEKKLDFKFVSIIHPSSQLARNVKIGEGTVLMAGTVINSDSKIGNHCIINTKASIDHDNDIGDFVNIQPNATTGGNVEIKNYSTLGLGAEIIQKIKIGEHTIIGAGSTVLNDIPSFVVVFGTPAEVHRKRSKGEKYL